MTRIFRRSNFKGYTFIEVLVAMAIFSSMVMLATMALNQGLRQYKGLMEKGVNFWDKAKYLWIDSSFGAVVDYYVYKEKAGWFPYFYGDSEKISYISLSPLAGDLPVIAWIVKENRDNGLFAVVYYELPVYTKTCRELDWDYVGGDYKKGNSLTLLDGVQSIDIEFYGFDVLGRNAEWSQNFDGSKRRSLPSTVKMTYVSGNKKQTLLFCINTNTMRKADYNDTQ
ncbi:MAG: prepilin-type N-terminal cleavage/methylation domain-containing protein [Nitrospirae bacterium]|nr:prepilin-type N-terminal cleavage/methylation domain-containing protein [Nitrospirota bacterium]